MTCRIADNPPLSQLRAALDAPNICHSRRPTCVHALQQDTSLTALGAPGAALGYCQALFGASATPEEHTRNVIALLREIEAPWPLSHELFWGYHRTSSPAEYVTRAIEPLRGDGRMPILITGLDPAGDAGLIGEMLRANIPVPRGEAALLRMVLRDGESIAAAAALLGMLVRDAFATHEMPFWWPLFQGDLTAMQWEEFRNRCGDAWRYTNIAVNPFVTDEAFRVIRDQVTVAQVVVGAPGGVANDVVHVPAAMHILGARGEASYSLLAFIERLRVLPVVPTLILLGPADTSWAARDNQARIRDVLVPLRAACERLWSGLSTSQRAMIWQLAA